MFWDLVISFIASKISMFFKTYFMGAHLLVSFLRLTAYIVRRWWSLSRSVSSEMIKLIVSSRFLDIFAVSWFYKCINRKMMMGAKRCWCAPKDADVRRKTRVSYWLILSYLFQFSRTYFVNSVLEHILLFQFWLFFFRLVWLAIARHLFCLASSFWFLDWWKLEIVRHLSKTNCLFFYDIW